MSEWSTADKWIVLNWLSQIESKHKMHNNVNINRQRLLKDTLTKFSSQITWLSELRVLTSSDFSIVQLQHNMLNMWMNGY